MSLPMYTRLLYLGRQTALPQAVQAIWQDVRATEPAATRPPMQIIRVTSQALARDALRAHNCQAILLEVSNQRQNRARFCQDLRRRFPELRILVLCNEPIQPSAFVFDGTLHWPLRTPEVESVLGSIFSAEEETQLRLGPIQLKVATRTLIGPRGRHQLPPKQCNLLRILMVHASDVVSRETIMRTVWETAYLADTRTIDVHIRWLREKIEPDPSQPVHLLTVRGQGYRLVAG
jgi:DNA-binding response OmpR family regulator